MKTRILTAIIGIPLVLAVVIFSNTLVLPLAVTLFCVVGVWEMLGCIGVRRMPSVTVPTLIVAAGLPNLAYFADKLGGRVSFVALMGVIFFLYFFLLLCLAVFSKGKRDASDMALTAVMTAYISVGFTSLVLLRSMATDAVPEYGLCLFILVFVGAWVPDGAGYFGGRAFGKHKLIPDVSPKKTVEGAVCGVIFGAVSFALTGLVFDLLGYGKPDYIALCAVGLIVAVISICGDLIASLIKRKYGVKDYGKLFPGHGGVMDRFDSIIAIAPFLAMVCAVPSVFMLIK